MSQQNEKDHIWAIMRDDGQCQQICKDSKQKNSNDLSHQSISKAASNSAQSTSINPDKTTSQKVQQPKNLSSNSKPASNSSQSTSINPDKTASQKVQQPKNLFSNSKAASNSAQSTSINPDKTTSQKVQQPKNLSSNSKPASNSSQSASINPDKTASQKVQQPKNLSSNSKPASNSAQSASINPDKTTSQKVQQSQNLSSNSKPAKNDVQSASGYPGQIASQINRQQNSNAFQQNVPSASVRRTNSDRPAKGGGHPLSPEDIERQKIANENYHLIKNHPELVPMKGVTIRDSDHDKIKSKLRKVKSRFEDIVINNYSTIGSAIYYHKHGYKNIYVLNFADALKAGGGYLNGRNAQEECLCRQTLLYPTIRNNDMYKENTKFGPEGSDIMIYSPDVLVIRDDNYNWIKKNEQFKVNIISSPAVDKRGNIKNADAIMEIRIRKIIYLAAYKSLEEKNQGKNVLILGAFGCGVFKNDPKMISSLFAKVLNGEKLKDYFNLIVFPIFKGSHETTQTFQNALKPAGKK